MEKPRVERRLAAIMMADVVGYSRLIEANESATIAAVRELRQEVVEPALAQNQGRIVKLMGDAILAEFGSVVDAVACAVAIQKEIAEPGPDATPGRLLVLRIGINLGDIVVDGDDILGDAVNVASRLQQMCEPGGVLISGTAYDHMQGRLGLPIDFVGEAHVKNIERPVRSYAVRFGDEAVPVGERSAAPWRGMAIAAAVLLVAAAAGGAAYYFWLSKPPPIVATAKPSIAVLPFANLGADAASKRLAEGLTDDIITDLTRYRDFDIIARNSLEAYRSQPTDVRKIRDELSVRYLLEGSIQWSNDRIRVNAKLVDVATGTNIWSDRWDRPAADVFAVQSEVAEHTASAVAGSDLLLSDMNAEARRKLPKDLQAYDLTVLAYESLLKGTEADTVAGINYADQAISRDPNFARAYVQKAWLVQELAKYRRNWNEASRQMEELARIAIRLDPYDANAHILLAWTLGTLGKNSEALEETTRALELNPSSADILNMAADTMAFLGKPEEGLAMCDRSFRLNPTPPDWYYTDCVSSFYFAGRYEQAVDAVNRGSAATDASPSVLVWKAASEAELGRTGAATGTVKRLEALYWEVSFEWLLNTGWNFERDQERDKILASAKKAGVRICATADELTEFSSPKRLAECEAQTSG